MSKISLKDKIAIDAKRTTDEERGKVILFREGKFFRAFNRSAWLISQYIYNEEYRKKIGAISPLSVTRNKSQGDTDYILCGFPIHSIEKYSGGLPYEVINDEQAVITLPEFALGMTEEEYDQAYAEFASTIVAKPKKSEEQRQFGTSDEEGRPRSLGMIDIIRKVNNYSLAEHTPVEVMHFLQEIQNDIHRLM